MFTPGKSDYGLGWAIVSRNDRLIIGHGGGIEGFNTSINRYPEQDAVIIALSNTNTDMGAIGRKLEELLFENEPAAKAK
jgi:hypothetical protein